MQSSTHLCILVKEEKKKENLSASSDERFPFKMLLFQWLVLEMWESWYLSFDWAVSSFSNLA